MKKIICVILTLVMLASLAACQSPAPTPEQSPDDAPPSLEELTETYLAPIMPGAFALQARGGWDSWGPTLEIVFGTPDWPDEVGIMTVGLEDISYEIFEQTIPIDESAIGEADMFYVEIVKWLDYAHFEMDSTITEQEKADFFTYLFSRRDMFLEQWGQWLENGDDIAYVIPLAEIEEILFAYLDIDSFDPLEAFGPLEKADWSDVPIGYDEENEQLVWVPAGFGGARGHGVLDIMRDGDDIAITIGAYDIDLNITWGLHVLYARYTVRMRTFPDEPKRFQIQYAVYERVREW